MLFLVLISLILAAILALFARFATAEGDFTLLSKGHAKREEVDDKVVWITGASRGIGEILAKQFARLGAKLILSARNEAELERVKAELVGKHAPGEVKVLPLDLASGEDSLLQAVEKAESFFPDAGVEYMVHNAAYERPKSTALDVTEEALRMSSAAGKTPAPGQAVYSASKYAINGYFHTLRSEKRVTSERCAELTIVAATHGLKEVWISNQPVLAVMYLVQYMPTIGYWLMDKFGGNRVEAAAQKSNTYAWSLLFGHKKKAT
ncbi:uncharacterized protein LOC131240175 isoform X7 [Magnolia sinica]|uniref:uncharacterized protein LOC131240175 isoform X7 n=1 Tax=Magnolia sinica TaxID=86752 RepID=UPI002659EE19|nr:uncharacterized protein LOC131240175 isoform X7 [Magnolia sinica]